ncbi:amino acid adenylation domain-containing protein [Streptomyces sp. NPDC047079]|uniref:amino acid adenylation domain-containing protein n=1 Tax=Streptomyces sp. NPDC047079 TaxID=3154607 RepID=UPI0034004C6C
MHASDPSAAGPLHRLFARRAASNAGSVAVADGERELTYEQLDGRANQLARLLLSAGAGDRVPVAVLLHRDVRLAVALLAVWKAGAAYVPLDPDHPAARTEGILADTGATVVVTEPQFAHRIPDGVRPVVVDPSFTALDGLPSEDPDVAITGVHPAYVLYTSGSTGRPKGVVVTHEGLANQVAWRVRTHRLGPGDRVLHKTPVTFDAAGWEIFAPLISGGTVVMAPVGAERDPALLVRTVTERRITVLQVVPSLLRMLVDEPGWSACTTLRLLSSGGEQLHAELVRRFLRCVEDAPADIEVWNTYGPTECSNEVAGHCFDPVQRSGPVPVGTPVDGIRFLIADSEGRPVEPGQSGELHIGGIGLAQGYLGRPDLTAERFVPDPYGPPGARLYRTGDLVRERADGALVHMGRADDQVKVNGVRIEPGEVEAALEAHPGIHEAAVTSFTAPGGGTRLAAYVRHREGGGTPDPDELRRFLADRLPQSHLPSVCVAVESFPRTSSGKLDRRALPPPEAPGEPVTAPAGEAEELVAGLWREVLGVDAVAPHDDFFRLGGSSLQLTRLANRLRTATGTPVEVSRLLRATTVAAQARLLEPDGDRTPPVRPVPRTGPLPVSPGQRRLWLLEQINPRGREWVTGVLLRVPADDPDERVQAALDVLKARHEALRTRFVTGGDPAGEPSQVVDAPSPMELHVVTTPRERVAEVVERSAREGFDLAQGPVVRALLIGAPEREPADARGERRLVVLMHHIVADGWSATVLREEFEEVLRALREGREPRLRTLPVQYADYAVWQRARLTEDLVGRELAYWKAALDGSEPLTLPTDRPRPPVRDAHGAIVTFTVPAAVADALGELGRRGDATPFMVLLTAFSTLLARYTARWDVVIGSPVAGRERPEIEGVVGFFLNSLVLRCALDASLTFAQALDRVRDVCKEAFGHQELPFEELVAELAPERDPSRTPLYQVAFDYHDEALSGSAADTTDLDAVTGVSSVAKTDLTLYMRRQADGTLLGALEYATSLFEHTTVERMASHFGQLLACASAAPQRRLDSLDLLSDAERRAQARRNDTGASAPARSVPALFAQAAKADGTRPALVADGTTVTFAELESRAARLARHLRARGTGPESVVGVLLDRGVELPTALLAVWQAGGAYLPLDPATPATRVGQVLADAGVRVVVTQAAHRGLLAPHFTGEVIAVDTDAAAIAAHPGGPPDHPAHLDPRHGRDLDLLAYVIYTSGSTGRPKGVQITHGGLVNHVRWAVDELTARGGSGAALFSSAAFDLVVPNLWAPLLAGQPLHLLPHDLDLSELGPRLDAVAPLSFLKLTPGHLEILSRQLDADRLARLAGVVVAAGETLPVSRADTWARILGPGRLINEYGPTETSVGACTHPVTAPVTGGSVPIGRPLPGVTMQVLDDLMRPVPVGVVGELYIGGLGVARGYAARPELTAASFVPDPYGPAGARLYRTGDLARRLPDGDVDFVGRRDGQVKIRGHRVETGEVKTVLETHPAVREAVVVVVEHGGVTGLAAYWVPASPAEASAHPREELAAYCAGRLPDYMVPTTFTPIGTVPLTANGKLDRAALPDPRQEAAEADEEPRGVVEERLAEIFEDLLGARAGRHTHFFRGGGNSILAIRLIAEIQQAFDIDFPARAVFEGSTVAELAAAVEAEVRAEVGRMTPAELLARARQLDEQDPGE